MLTEQQKEIRKKGLGATDCAVVMGLSHYKTPYELWLEKTGRKESAAILSDDRLHLRHAHEETISREYARRRGVKLRRVNQTVFHKRLPFMLCNLDRVIIGQKKIIECKSASGFMRGYWGETGSDEAPIEYLLQVQHQMACAEYEDSDIAALIDIDDYRIYAAPRNEKIIKKIEDACEKFWVENVLADIPPPPTTRGDLKLMYPVNNGNFIEANAEALYSLSYITGMKQEIKTLDIEKEKAEKALIEIIADNDGLIDNEGKLLVTFQANKSGNRTLLIKKRG
jgi:putative phage-type endonuclease